MRSSSTCSPTSRRSSPRTRSPARSHRGTSTCRPTRSRCTSRGCAPSSSPAASASAPSAASATWSKPGAMRSLRQRLVAWLMLPLIVVGVVAGGGAYVFLERRLTAAYDLDLADIARAMVRYVRATDGVVSLVFNDQAEAVLRADSTDQILYAVLDSRGRVVAGDATLPHAPFEPAPAPRFWDDVHQGKSIRAVTIGASVD